VEAGGDFKRNRTIARLAERLFIHAAMCDNDSMGGIASVRAIVRGAFAALALLAAATVQAAAPPARIVAVGDLHGDYSAWLDIARDARLIDAKGHWAGGATTLVQLGDVTDREPDSLKIIHSLQQLAKEAPRSRGKVVVVLGNHEAMNLVGDLRYTTAGEFASYADAQSAERRERVFQMNQAKIEASYRAKNPAMTAAAVHDAWIAATPIGWIEHHNAWAPSGELGQWAVHNPAVVKIGGTLFVHGGLSAESAAIPLAVLNNNVRKAMAAADDSNNSVLYDPLGPLWYRGLVGADPEAAKVRAMIPQRTPPANIDDELTKVLAAYGAKRMVIGHTPSLAGIRITNGGRLARIDTGISRFYGGPVSWLEIAGDRLIPHTVTRSAP
jgi:hypothetical protein